MFLLEFPSACLSARELDCVFSICGSNFSVPSIYIRSCVNPINIRHMGIHLRVCMCARKSQSVKAHSVYTTFFLNRHWSVQLILLHRYNTVLSRGDCCYPLADLYARLLKITVRPTEDCSFYLMLIVGLGSSSNRMWHDCISVFTQHNADNSIITILMLFQRCQLSGMLWCFRCAFRPFWNWHTMVTWSHGVMLIGWGIWWALSHLPS